MSYLHKIDWRNVTPLNGNIILTLEQETEKKSEGGIWLTQMYKPTNHFRILKVPVDIEYPLGPNDQVMLHKLNPALLERFMLDRDEKTFIIPLSYIFAVWKPLTRRMLPIGPSVLVRRWIHTEMDLETKLIKPAFTFEKDQTLEVEVLDFGILKWDEPWNTPIKLGDLVHLKAWSMEHVEVKVGSEYCLVVPEKDLSHIEYGRQSVLEYA